MKRRVTLEVDDIQLFDTLRKMEGNTSPLGDRLVGALLTKEIPFATRLGMGMYGITVVDPEPEPEAPKEAVANG